MKNNIKYIAGILLGGLIGFSACTDSFESFNTNEAGFDNDSKNRISIIMASLWESFSKESTSTTTGEAARTGLFRPCKTWGQIYSRDMCMTSIPSTKERTTALTT